MRSPSDSFSDRFRRHFRKNHKCCCGTRICVWKVFDWWSQSWAAPAPELCRLLGPGTVYRQESEPDGKVLLCNWSWSRSRTRNVWLEPERSRSRMVFCGSEIFSFCLHSVFLKYPFTIETEIEQYVSAYRKINLCLVLLYFAMVFCSG